MAHWLDDVYRDHAQALHRFLVRLTGHEADTRDLLQEIFIRLARTPGILDRVVAPRSFLFRLAHRLVIDRYRRNQSHERAIERAALEQLVTALPDPIHDEAPWLQRNIAIVLDSLPLEQKAVVVLKIWEELTFAEIADVLDIPPNTAASRYRYALDKLRERLRPLHRDLP